MGLAAVIAAAERRRVRRWRCIGVVGGGFVVWVVVGVVVRDAMGCDEVVGGLMGR